MADKNRPRNMGSSTAALLRSLAKGSQSTGISSSTAARAQIAQPRPRQPAPQPPAKRQCVQEPPDDEQRRMDALFREAEAAQASFAAKNGGVGVTSTSSSSSSSFSTFRTGPGTAATATRPMMRPPPLLQPGSGSGVASRSHTAHAATTNSAHHQGKGKGKGHSCNGGKGLGMGKSNGGMDFSALDEAVPSTSAPSATLGFGGTTEAFLRPFMDKQLQRQARLLEKYHDQQHQQYRPTPSSRGQGQQQQQQQQPVPMSRSISTGSRQPQQQQQQQQVQKKQPQDLVTSESLLPPSPSDCVAEPDIEQLFAEAKMSQSASLSKATRLESAKAVQERRDLKQLGSKKQQQQQQRQQQQQQQLRRGSAEMEGNSGSIVQGKGKSEGKRKSALRSSKEVQNTKTNFQRDLVIDLDGAVDEGEDLQVTSVTLPETEEMLIDEACFWGQEEREEEEEEEPNPPPGNHNHTHNQTHNQGRQRQPRHQKLQLKRAGANGNHKHQGSVHKDGEWTASNLSLHLRNIDQGPVATRRRQALYRKEQAQKEQKSLASEHARLKANVAAAGAAAGLIGQNRGGLSAEAFCQRVVQTALQRHARAQAAKEELQEIIKTLQPGPQYLSAMDELSKAHVEAQAASEDLSKKRKGTADYLRASKSAAAVSKHAEAIARLQQEVNEAEQEIQETERALAPAKRLLDEAREIFIDAPPVSFYISLATTATATSRARGGTLGQVAACLRFDPVVVLPDQRGLGGEPSRVRVALLVEVLSRWRDNEVVILEVRRECTQDLWYVGVSPVALQRMQESQDVPMPQSLQLLKAALGIYPGFDMSPDARQMILATTTPKPREAPPALKATLRCYQLEGFQWLAQNAENGIGSLLADDMGLGKTLQTIALLSYMHHKRSLQGRPALIVCPFSVLSTWEQELRKWAPSLRCHRYHGASRADRGLNSMFAKVRRNEVDVILTTYSLLQRDISAWCCEAEGAVTSLGCIVLDEGHAIKNPKSLTAAAALRLAQFHTRSARVVLSGTPIQNRLGEIHTIFEFLNQGFLGQRDDFVRSFERQMRKQAGGDEDGEAVLAENEALERLGTALGPLVLRREKSNKAILQDLPDKIEVMHEVTLTALQSELYNAFVEEAMAALQEAEMEGATREAGGREASVGSGSYSGSGGGGLDDQIFLEELAGGEDDGPEQHVFQDPSLRDEKFQTLQGSSASASAGVTDLEAADDGAQPTASTATKAKNPLARRARVLASLHSLQQTCNHPAAVKPAQWPDSVQALLPDVFGGCAFDENGNPTPGVAGGAATSSAATATTGRRLGRGWPGPGVKKGAMAAASATADPSLADFRDSGKTTRLLDLLEEITGANDKVLIFTQYVKTLHLLAGIIEARFPGISCCKHEGSMTVEERDKSIRDFSTEPKCSVMILTLGSGGVGLTLTAASHVIHFDRCWNPAKEAQATDRAHRMGQKKTVVVHRFQTVGTFEQRLDAVVARKKHLADATMGRAAGNGARVVVDCSRDELLELFKLTGYIPSNNVAAKRRWQDRQESNRELRNATAAALGDSYNQNGGGPQGQKRRKK